VQLCLRHAARLARALRTLRTSLPKFEGDLLRLLDEPLPYS
jgi:hypothetical protein